MLSIHTAGLVQLPFESITRLVACKAAVGTPAVYVVTWETQLRPTVIRLPYNKYQHLRKGIVN